MVVMYIETVKNRNSPPCILLRESYREDGRVKKRTVANLTNWPKEVVSQLRVAMSNKACADFDIIRSLPHGHVAAVLRCMKNLKISGVLGGRPCREKDLATALIAQRILSPGSKLATARLLGTESAASSLGEELGLAEVSETELYAAMDWLLERQDAIEAKLAKRHLGNGAPVLYDLTSVYMEGTKCPLSAYGYSRDGKKGKLQIEFGLLCDEDGRPVAVRVFEGNVADPTTVAERIRTLKDKFGLSRVVVVGDRGMLTSARIREDLSPEDGIDWISALTTDGIRKLQSEELIQPELFDQQNLAEVNSPSFPDERLIVCRNPHLAARRANKREELLAATEVELAKVKAATQRDKRALKGIDKIAMRAGRALDRFKMRKHFKIEVTETDFHYERRVENIAEEAALDGIYVVRSSLKKDDAGADELVGLYKSLSRVERAFRSIKTVDLNVRPIFHRTADRVRAHVLLCMLAYYVEWQLKETLAPLLFKDEHPELAAEKRDCVADQARRSDQALDKIATKKTADGHGAHSLRTLLSDLATVTRNVVQFKVKDSLPVVRFTTPTSLQAKAFELLGVRLS